MLAAGVLVRGHRVGLGSIWKDQWVVSKLQCAPSQKPPKCGHQKHYSTPSSTLMLPFLVALRLNRDKYPFVGKVGSASHYTVTKNPTLFVCLCLPQPAQLGQLAHSIQSTHFAAYFLSCCITHHSPPQILQHRDAERPKTPQRMATPKTSRCWPILPSGRNSTPVATCGVERAHERPLPWPVCLQ
jgi:hypothetical protein